ncbi:unnamed protein product [Alopecurus aequalis]
MAVRKRSVCLVALMVVVMATVMLSCDADVPEWCESIRDGCTYSQCRGVCGSRNLPNGFRCAGDGKTCCCSDKPPPRPVVDGVRPL